MLPLRNVSLFLLEVTVSLFVLMQTELSFSNRNFFFRGLLARRFMSRVLHPNQQKPPFFHQTWLFSKKCKDLLSGRSMQHTKARAGDREGFYFFSPRKKKLLWCQAMSTAGWRFPFHCWTTANAPGLYAVLRLFIPRFGWLSSCLDVNLYGLQKQGKQKLTEFPKKKKGGTH